MSPLHTFTNTAELHTVRDWLRFAVSAFNEGELSFGHGSVTAYDEAVYLILHTLHLPLDTLEPFLDARLTLQEKAVLMTLLKRRVEQKIPASYLTHEAWLGEFKFYVDERVIVPRSFIAELLREALFPWVADAENTTSVLDLCTGSGCLAIIAAHAFPNAQIDAVDLSPEALQVAQRNVSDYHLPEQVHLIQSDLFAQLSGKKYDIIISNPPYVDAEAVAALPQEYLHEPELALGSGSDGLDATREILKHAAEHLTPHGILIVEIGHNRDALEAAFPKLPFTWLDVSAGDEFVFLLHRNDLIN
ncbi:MAG: ribosomal protein L3 N(5)-glutamine methyltransferase [Gallionellales bacterium 35-53-114]|jgi:ribosomal protein L3 glutamine methyltransferase|nr:MAG: ribosomal protein L3 N(5)-glutamine methyltransferase [Gallionellales bacterium 35-53-114]OYZ64703.1 MAG: ribosomal protein L3 N(5)-glutamine methyltransferase [Gallionellales bacterium 24-53-125]OZB07758.1 MAG: ribosomal protein L3 N(5)-glutamine methyltransferase [Gallionellales bacterium 39-52-133]HQS58533.1 50S ribosomal protein L3 N(5)-glutamine methyltransferase [Gallionellaceae bacterium]HQS74874.1 50S ribosomal protein L3 N(5)-glutamine methyltransferase [Gallionellaceae bacteri